MDTNTLFVSLFFSFVGIGFYAFGKGRNFYFQIFGFCLMLFPYFFSNFWPLLSVGILLLLLPFLLTWLLPL